MALSVKSGYVNPLTMMGQKEPIGKHQMIQRNRKSVQILQLQQQSLQNKIVLLKGTSDGDDISEETQNQLEEQIEKISAELKTAKTDEISDISTEKPNLSSIKARFDFYEQGDMHTQSFGLYQMQHDGEKGYRIQFSPFSE